MYSFSQNFEDVYIYRAFRDVDNGFYIDAGAFDPVVDSVTKMLYDLGWSGINLEPGPSFPRFSIRVRDINLPYAVTGTEGEAVFHYNAADPATSTTAATNVPADSSLIESYTVQAKTLEAIVRDHASDRHIHFVKLDIEGAEWDVLRNTDWNVVRPELIIAESSLPYSNQRRDSGWADHMKSFGYHEVFFDGINTYYLREESLFRRGAFQFPVNVIDNVRKFDPYQHYTLADEKGSGLIDSISQEVARVVETESSVVREFLERDLGPQLKAEKELVEQLRAEESEHFARLQSIVAEIPNCASATIERGNRRGNSIDAVIEHLADGLADLVEHRDRLAAEVVQAREAAEAATAALREQQTLADEARSETRVLARRLSHARASRTKIIELTQRVAEALAESGGAQEPQVAATGHQSTPAAASPKQETDPLTARITRARRVAAWRRLIRFRNRALVRRADSYRDSGRWAEAAEAYARSYALRPDRPDLCLQMANMLTQLRKFELAEEAYREALAKSPGDSLILLHLGHMLEISGRQTEARQAYSESAKHLPNHPDVANGLRRIAEPQDASSGA